MTIYKKTGAQSPWQPYQYYSAFCEETYGIEPDQLITREDETKAICTAEYSDIVPLSGGHVIFSSLVGRPGAYASELSPGLQVILMSLLLHKHALIVH